jgi:pimeloyl-ACP methyl ester carboxylesterase
MFVELHLKGAHVIAHDMGDGIACELLARHVDGDSDRAFSAHSLTLSNGPLVMDGVHLRLMQRLLRSNRFGALAARVAARPLFGRQIRRTNGTDRLSRTEILHMWEILAVSGGHRRGHLLIRFMEDFEEFERTRWLPALKHACRAGLPVRFVWGDADRMTPVSIARRVIEEWCPEASLRVVSDGGHFLQLDSPREWLGAVLPPFLQSAS